VELTNEFSVRVPVEEAWTLLNDLERIAPCMPGFELQEVEGDEYRGMVKVKVGPMTAQYRGVASFRERDEANRRAVVRAEGRETRGQGNASATVTATLEPEDGGTHVTLHTDLKITGKVAQFGRGVLADVSSKLLRQFVEALEADMLAGASRAESEAGAKPVSEGRPRATRDAPPAPAATVGARRIESTSSEPVDLLATAGSSVIKRVAPLVVLLVVVFWLVRHC
jgi:carbon monoxide dehydrogenase subunit G